MLDDRSGVDRLRPGLGKPVVEFKSMEKAITQDGKEQSPKVREVDTGNSPYEERDVIKVVGVSMIGKRKDEPADEKEHEYGFEASDE